MFWSRKTAVAATAWVVGVVIVCGRWGVQGEMFSAIAHLETLLQAERAVADDLRLYIDGQMQRLERLRKIADDFQKHSDDALVDSEHHLGNPVNAFLLIKRFTDGWNRIVQNDIMATGTEEFLTSLQSKTCYFPDQDDLRGAASGLLRLQDVYALDTAKLARGEIQGVHDSPHMTAEDCFTLGSVAYNDGDFYHTIMWMEQALRIVDSEQQPTVSKAVVLDYLSYAVYMQGNIFHALNYTRQWLSIEPDHARAMNNERFYEQLLAEEQAKRGLSLAAIQSAPVRNERPLDEWKRTPVFYNYEALCRGEKVMDYHLKHKLTCRYLRHHPTLLISPIKEEMVYFDPPIRIFYNVLTKKEMETVRLLGQPLLSRSVVFHQANQQGTTVQEYRVSKSAWLPDSADPIISGLSLKARVLSNLTLDTAEFWQVLNYGIGGHYETHCDFATKRELSTFEQQQGNRVATFICYISDVKAGGSTVFPEIGVQLVPGKGNCGLWYNLRRSGDGDFQTRHAACPVLTGYKWACNKWFHERGQEFIRGCTTSPSD